MAFTNNFSTSFRWWDRLFGTDDKYRAYRARVKAAKKAMKNASADDIKKFEEKLMDEVEQEGIIAEKEAESRGTFGAKTVKVQ